MFSRLRRMTATISTATAANRLANSKSPYLRQHANNPVDWYEWSEEALKVARESKRPIFVSIGYSTCHWCHVMAEESFSDPEVAKVLNENFVNIKIDREERPDLDRQFMLYVQSVTGSGGWPLNVFLSPSLIPIFGGTYFGPKEAAGRPSFTQVLSMICARWSDQPANLEDSGRRLINQLRKATDFVPGKTDSDGDVTRVKAIQKAFLFFEEAFDREWGGFGASNKFPMPGTLEMLLRYWALWRELGSGRNPPSANELAAQFGQQNGVDEAQLRAKWDEVVQNGLKMAEFALKIVEFTLVNIVRGGLRDHVAGGFHRYTVDRAWTLPHFEKMLYDQAQLIHVLSNAALVVENESIVEEFKTAIHEAIKYVKGRLYDSNLGLFYSAEDADSVNTSGVKEEGSHVTWTDADVNKVLQSAGWSAEDVKVFKYHYTVLPRGNVSMPGEVNVLRERVGPAVTAEKLKRSLEDVKSILSRGRELLMKERTINRQLPHRDEKCITAWNGRMIGALARASRTLHSPEYLQLAQSTARALLANCSFIDGELLMLRRVAGNEAIPAFAEDYAALIGGLLELYAADFDAEWLNVSERLFATLDELFRDKAAFGYYDSAKTMKSETAGILRMKDDNDGVEPSANSQQALNALHLHLLSATSKGALKKHFLERLRQIEKVFTQKRLKTEPQAMTGLVSAIILDAGKPATLMLNRKPEGELKSELDSAYRPHLIVRVVEDENEKVLKGHLCRSNVCSAPTEDVQSLIA